MGMNQKIFPFIGIPRIKIPIKASEVNSNTIAKYLPKIFAAHAQNEAKIDYCYNAYLGKHDILTKTRLYSDDAGNNNKIVENHFFAQVEFKKGYLLGNPKEYAQFIGKPNEQEGGQTSESRKTDDIGFLQKYNSEQNLSSIDTDVTEFAYATGVGYYFIIPKRDDFNPQYEAPYEVYCQDPRNACKVYSSYIGEEELFDIIFVHITDENNNKKIILSVYTKTQYMEFTTDLLGGSFELTTQPEPRIFKDLPLVEKYFHRQKISITELGLTIQNAIDLLTSGSLDAFIDNANSILALMNVDIDSETTEQKLEAFQKMKKSGLFLLKTNNPAAPADIKQLSNSINHKDINVKYENLIKVMYDTVGVPLSSGNVTSGGDTGQARLLGNGWENAYTIILKDIRSLIRADKKLLKKMLAICKFSPKTKDIIQLNESEIEIKYNINRSDNLLVKTQSLQNLRDVNMPLETSLQMVGIVSDPHSVATEWQREIETKKIEQEKENNKQQDNKLP